LHFAKFVEFGEELVARGELISMGQYWSGNRIDGSVAERLETPSPHGHGRSL